MKRNISENTEVRELRKKSARRFKRAELLSGIGMLLVAVGLMLPLFYLYDTGIISAFKWIYTAGAALCVAGRCSGIFGRTGESTRLARLRRLELWASICFAAGAFFWFYNSDKFASLPVETGALSILRDTIIFSMAGAMIQVIAAWLIYYREKKESSVGK